MLNNLDTMAKRLNYHGGFPQQDRMIKDKKWSLDHAILYSYQGAVVQKIGEEEEPRRALINPNKKTQDYDDKIISIDYDYGYKPGDVFTWSNTNTYWLIYLQDLTELAYFRGDIRRCSYTIEWINEDKEHIVTHAAVRGPVETKINSIQKNGISVDVPNHSLNVLIPKNEDTLKKFRRYSKFYLQGIEEADEHVCWRIEAVDTISMPGVIQFAATKYYANEFEDDIEGGVIEGLIVDPIPPEPSDSEIVGEVFIKPKNKYVYEYTGGGTADWSFEPTKLPISYNIEDNKLILIWNSSYTGQFVIKCGGKEKTVVVESLF